MESQPKYDNVHLDDVDEEASNTEVEESLIGDREKGRWTDEEFALRARKSRRSRWGRAFTRSRWCIDTILLVAIFGLLLRQQLKEPSVPPYDFNGDITGFTPKFSQQIIRFQPDQRYVPNNVSEFFSNDTLKLWNDLMPLGIGFQHVKHPERYHDLPTPTRYGEGMAVFTTSTTHQLHCLWTLAMVYSGMKANHTLPDDHHWHMIHCFDYMRQTIMCTADMALEGLETTFPDHNGGSDGWDAKHVCKDWSQVKTYMESVRPDDRQQIY